MTGATNECGYGRLLGALEWCAEYRPPVTVDRLQDLLPPTEDLLSKLDRPWKWDWFKRLYLPVLCHRERTRVFIVTGRYFYWTHEVERELQNVCNEILNAYIGEFNAWGIEVDVDEWHRGRLDIDAFCDASRCFELLPVADRNILKAEYMIVPAQLRPYVEGSVRSYSPPDVLRIRRKLRDLMNGVNG